MQLYDDFFLDSDTDSALFHVDLLGYTFLGTLRLIPGSRPEYHLKNVHVLVGSGTLSGSRVLYRLVSILDDHPSVYGGFAMLLLKIFNSTKYAHTPASSRQTPGHGYG